MFERSAVVFKVLCAALGAVAMWQVVRAIERSDPLAGASIPALPSLPASTNTQAQARGSNAPPSRPSAKAGTNVFLEAPAAHGTNPITHGPSEKVAAQGAKTSLPPSAGNARTNRPARPEAALGMMNPGPPPGMPGQGPPLPPAVQSRLDRIIESEILAPLMHPQPVALLGIVGTDAFLQAPNGQSGLIKEGQELGGIKLLKLGINRALIEEAGEKKELTLFSGLGSESLLSKQTNNP